MGHIGPPGRRTRTAGTVSAKDRSAGGLRPVWGRSLSPIQPDARPDLLGQAFAMLAQVARGGLVERPPEALDEHVAGGWQALRSHASMRSRQSRYQAMRCSTSAARRGASSICAKNRMNRKSERTLSCAGDAENMSQIRPKHLLKTISCNLFFRRVHYS